MDKRQVINLLKFIRESEQSTINGDCDDFLSDNLNYCSDIIETIFNDIDTCIQIDELIDDDILSDDFIGKMLSSDLFFDSKVLEKIVKEYEFEEEEGIIKLCGRIRYISSFSLVFNSLPHGVDDFYTLWNNKDLIIRIVQNKATQDAISEWLIEKEDEKMYRADYEEFADKVMEILREE